MVENKNIHVACGHSATTMSSDSPSTTPPDCTQACTVMLSCGHPCVGNCSDCLQGRVHVPCKSKCGRTLVCGHKCEEPCTKNCPPCNKKCENRCVHKQCTHGRCGEPCEPCLEPCPWTCEHFTCTRTCSEPCNRTRCNEPCKQTLSCGHECVGLCGEACPILCRVCNNDELTEIFFGEEDEENARYVELSDCGHIFEVTGLDQWMEKRDVGGTGNNVEIQLKKCPRCNVTIRLSLRYKPLMISTLRDVDRVKERVLVGDSNIESLMERQGELEGQFNPMDWPEVFRSSIEWYMHRVNLTLLSVQELNCLQNVLNFLDHIITWSENAIGLYVKFLRSDELMASELQKIIEQLEKALIPAVLRDRILIRQQELHELGQEITRYDLIKDTFEIIYKFDSGTFPRVTDVLRSSVRQSLEKLQSVEPLSASLETQVWKLLKEAFDAMSGLGITNTERVEILQAIDVKQGHWFKCPNNHIYVIGDCGGAMEEGRCPECKATIGGGFHALRPDNQLATEMDGALQPAWPGTINQNLVQIAPAELPEIAVPDPDPIVVQFIQGLVLMPPADRNV